jgi:hypothetical protein
MFECFGFLQQSKPSGSHLLTDFFANGIAPLPRLSRFALLIDQLLVKLKDAPAIARLLLVIALDAILLVEARILPYVLQVQYRSRCKGGAGVGSLEDDIPEGLIAPTTGTDVWNRH